MPLKTPLPDLPRYTFGAGDVGCPGGDAKIETELVRMAIEAGLWFHCSPQYGGRGREGGTFRFLRRVFDEAGRRPRMIVKLTCPTPEAAREDSQATLRALGLERIDIAQIVGEYIDFTEDFRRQGPRWEMFRKLKDEGLVGNYLCEIYPSNYAHALDVVGDDRVDGYIFYQNILERNVSDELNSLLAEKQADIVALRTLARVYIDFAKWDSRTADLPERVDPAHMEALKPLFERSGCRDWLQFAMWFALSLPQVKTTIGATTNPEHLAAYIRAAEEFQPLEADLVSEIGALRKAN